MSAKLLHVVNVHNRSISIAENPTIVEDGISVNQLDLKFDDEWNGLDINYFLSVGDGKSSRFQWYGEPVDIPAALIREPGVLYVGVIGYKGDTVRLTTSHMLTPFKVVKQSVGEEVEPPEPIEDIYGDIAGALAQVKDYSESVDAALAQVGDATSSATTAADSANKAADRANKSADDADKAADKANAAANLVGERIVEVFNDPDADDRVIIKYPSFLKSDDGASIYMNVTGGN